MQWLSVVLAYLLWLQMLYWIPQPVWDWVGECLDGPGDGDGCTLAADIPLFLWGVLCIFLAAFLLVFYLLQWAQPTFFIKMVRSLLLLKCLSSAFSNAFATWNFHFVDGYITVGQIIERIPSDDKTMRLQLKKLQEELHLKHFIMHGSLESQGFFLV
jgi:hypothetical protein